MNYGLNQASNTFNLDEQSQKQWSGIEKTAQPISAMGGATSELQMSLEVLAKVAEELRMRLSPVLRSSGPENASKDSGGAPRDVASPLRDQLGKCSMRVGSIRYSLNDILDRLEV